MDFPIGPVLLSERVVGAGPDIVPLGQLHARSWTGGIAGLQLPILPGVGGFVDGW